MNIKNILITQIIKNQRIVYQRASHVFQNFQCSFCQRTYSNNHVKYHVKQFHGGNPDVKIIKLNLDIKQFKFMEITENVNFTNNIDTIVTDDIETNKESVSNSKMVRKRKNVEVIPNYLL